MSLDACRGESEPDLTIVATPFVIQGHMPRVVACIGRSARLGFVRVECELRSRRASAVQRPQEKAFPAD